MIIGTPLGCQGKTTNKDHRAGGYPYLQRKKKEPLKNLNIVSEKFSSCKISNVPHLVYLSGIGFSSIHLPFTYLLNLGPIIITPINAAQPPTECTTVEPAKS